MKYCIQKYQIAPKSSEEPENIFEKLNDYIMNSYFATYLLTAVDNQRFSFSVILIRHLG